MLLKNLVVLSVLFSFSSASHAMEDQDLKSSSQIRQNYAENSELNVKWLNPKQNLDQYGLFGDGKADEEKINTLIGWAKENPHLNKINCWYDSQTTTQEALENTRNKLRNLTEAGGSQDKITFRDIWEIDYIQEHPTAFDSRQDIYFRADLARMAILLRRTKDSDEGVARFRFYSDLNIPVASLSLMFTDESRKLRYGGSLLSEIMEKYGFALSQNAAGDIGHSYENAFIVVDFEHEIARQSLQFGILEINRLRGEKFAADNYWENASSKDKKIKCQIVFTSFIPMMKYYAYLNGEYGVNDDQKNMPSDLQARIDRYRDPLKLFNLENVRERVSFKYGKDQIVPDYVGYQLAGKVHARTGLLVDGNGYIPLTKRVICNPSSGTLRELTIDVCKPISSFYSN
jgi:hypothetical protein